LIALVAPLPHDGVVLCRSMAALLELRLQLRLAPGTTAIISDCRTMEGNLVLAVFLSTEPDDQERVQKLAITEWNGFKAPSAAERVLLTKHFSQRARLLASEPEVLAEQLADSSLWARGDALSTLAAQWLSKEPATDAELKGASTFTSSLRSAVFLGDLFVQKP
jgi:hypothetical protein